MLIPTPSNTVEQKTSHNGVSSLTKEKEMNQQSLNMSMQTLINTRKAKYETLGHRGLTWTGDSVRTPLGKYCLTWNSKAESAECCTVKRGKKHLPGRNAHSKCTRSGASRRRADHERRDLQEQCGWRGGHQREHQERQLEKQAWQGYHVRPKRPTGGTGSYPLRQ